MSSAASLRLSSGSSSLLAKLGLCAGGLLLLDGISGGPAAPLALGAVWALTYGLACALAAGAQANRDWAAKAARLAVPTAFALLVALNVAGLIGTLTGAQAAQGSLRSALGNPWIAMPFYLLSAAAVLAEVAGGKLRVPQPLDLAVYLALPFKLLAGPLEPPRLLQQIAPYRFQWRPHRFMVAWPWIAMGAFMKYVIANRLEPARHLVLVDPVSSFCTAALFELKFYFDFAGYSFMAYGGAIAVGLRISQNFNHPFLAANVVLFWRSWHISLGRYLGRYVLEPNLSLWKGRAAKLVFASSIFLVSAMWHGGTLNYLLWGLFHGAVYWAYGHWMKRREVPAALGVAAMLLFFVSGRMLAIDADSARLLVRLGQFFDPSAYAGLLQASGDAFLSRSEGRALAIAAMFLALEWVSRRRHPARQGYHLMRRPWFALVLTLIFIVYGQDSGSLLYARI